MKRFVWHGSDFDLIDIELGKAPQNVSENKLEELSIFDVRWTEVSEHVYCPKCGAEDQFGIAESSWGSNGPRFLDCSCDNCGIAITNAGKRDDDQEVVSQKDWCTIVFVLCSIN